MTAGHRDERGYLLVLGAAALWSTSGLFIRWTAMSGGLSALALAFWRDLATFVCLFLLLALLRRRRPFDRALTGRVTRRDLVWLVGLGTVGVATFHVLWNLAMLHLGYAAATVLLYSSPAFVSLLAWLIWREPLTRFKVLAIAMTMTGCVLVAGLEELAGVDLTAGGLLLGLGAALSYGSFSLFGREVAPRYSPWTVLTYGFGFSVLVLLPFQFAIAPPGPVPAETWIWFAGLVVVATVLPFSIYLAGLRRLPASVASILAASEVAFAAFIGYFVFGEPLQAQQILGAGLVVGGVSLIAVKSNGA